MEAEETEFPAHQDPTLELQLKTGEYLDLYDDSQSQGDSMPSQNPAGGCVASDLLQAKNQACQGNESVQAISEEKKPRSHLSDHTYAKGITSKMGMLSLSTSKTRSFPVKLNDHTYAKPFKSHHPSPTTKGRIVAEVQAELCQKGRLSKAFNDQLVTSYKVSRHYGKKLHREVMISTTKKLSDKEAWRWSPHCNVQRKSGNLK